MSTQKTRIGIASDHAGYLYKHIILTELENQGWKITDFGASNDKASDYPDFAEKIGHAMFHNKIDRGILICGSGVGMCIAANKFQGIRASVCHDTYSAHQGVEHDDMNVLCLGERIIGKALAMEIVDQFLQAEFSGFEIHRLRVEKVLAIEAENMKEVL